MKSHLVVSLMLLVCCLCLAGCTAATVEPSISCEDGPVTAFVGFNVIPMTSETVLADQTVLVQGNRIFAVEPATTVTVPACATTIRGDGMYLMPGLADMHVHIHEASLKEWPASPLDLFIAYGVTTVRDSGANPIIGGMDGSFIFELRDLIRAGELVGPTIYSPGLIIKGSSRRPVAEVEARVDKGFDYIKFYPELVPAAVEQLLTASAKHGLYTIGHVPYMVGLAGAAEMGMDEVAHIEEIGFELLFDRQRPNRPLRQDQWLALLATSPGIPGEGSLFDETAFLSLYEDTLRRSIRELLDHDMSVVTTVGLSQVIQRKVADPARYLASQDAAYLPEWHRQDVADGVDKHQLMYAAVGDLTEWKTGCDLFLLRALHDAGVRLLAGTDAGSPHIGVVAGKSLHEELLVLTENGFTPYEALLTATVDAAAVVERMGGSGDFGTVTAGARADLVAVESDPLEAVSNTQAITGVMAAGRWYPAPELARLREIKEVGG